MVIDNEIVNVGGKKQVYNAAGVNVTSCDATTIPNTIVPPLCASAFSRDGLIYERK